MIGTKMTLRGLDCLRIARLPHSSFRPPNRHSREGGNPEGWGRARQVSTESHPSTDPIFIPWCAGPSRHERLVRKRCYAGQSLHSGESRNPEGEGSGENAIPRKNQGVPPFSHHGVPAPAGMSDWYENRRVQDASSRKTVTAFVIPAEAGIQRGGGERRECHPSGTNKEPRFHTMVCRPQPGCVIGTKMTLRGLDCLRIARLPHSSFRPPNRHSREGGNPEGRGWARQLSTKSPPSTNPNFKPWYADASRDERLP